MIDARHVVRSFGRRAVLRGVEFRLEQGEYALLTGPNGAGKTTLLRVLSGFAPPDAGCIRIAGMDLFDDPLRVRARIGYVPENAPLPADPRPLEYLRFRGRLRGIRGRALRRRVDLAAERCGVTEFRQELMGCLSRGQRVRIALADALLHDPPVLLLDDPLDGLDAAGREALIAILAEARGTATLLISTHRPEELRPSAGRRLALQDGVVARDERLPACASRAEAGAAR